MPFELNTFYDVIAKTSDELQDIEISLDTEKNTTTPLLSKVQSDEKNYHMFKVNEFYSEGFLGMEVPIKEFIEQCTPGRIMLAKFNVTYTYNTGSTGPATGTEIFGIRCANKSSSNIESCKKGEMPKLVFIEPDDSTSTTHEPGFTIYSKDNNSDSGAHGGKLERIGFPESIDGDDVQTILNTLFLVFTGKYKEIKKFSYNNKDNKQQNTNKNNTKKQQKFVVVNNAISLAIVEKFRSIKVDGTKITVRPVTEDNGNDQSQSSTQTPRMSTRLQSKKKQ